MEAFAYLTLWSFGRACFLYIDYFLLCMLGITLAAFCPNERGDAMKGRCVYANAIANANMRWVYIYLCKYRSTYMLACAMLCYAVYE